MNDIYKATSELIDYLRDYYLDIQDYIEDYDFPRIDYYFLINNISIFYNSLNISKMLLDKWNDTCEDEYLIYSLMFIPEKIVFKKSVYDNFLTIRNNINYMLKEDKED